VVDSINSYLPDEIRVLGMSTVLVDFLTHDCIHRTARGMNVNS